MTGAAELAERKKPRARLDTPGPPLRVCWSRSCGTFSLMKAAVELDIGAHLEQLCIHTQYWFSAGLVLKMRQNMHKINP